ncbi:hypothetical protein [Neochlamydia sp. AcF95]|uniref:hypothetical protein n=1 Tax=Neochlamydia sp. AcF95 TaxID=2795734 RepID=UPI001BC99911|nr:hypothetical protein [Neochlamydia sp. AcF95]MBS4169910.1 hypothetical protein [Neochlamydia sp. AcF95]
MYFTSMPAFGFETFACNAEDCYKEMIKKVKQRTSDLQQRKMSQLNVQIAELKEISSFNDPDYQKVEDESINNAAKDAWKIANIIKALGYIPLIGTLIGLSRISMAAKTLKEELPTKYNHIGRGCVELLSLGFLLLIPDLVLTAYRAYDVRNRNNRLDSINRWDVCKINIRNKQYSCPSALSHRPHRLDPTDRQNACKILDIPLESANDLKLIEEHYQQITKGLERRISKVTDVFAARLLLMLDDAQAAYRTLNKSHGLS